MNILRAYWQCGPLVIATAALSFSFTALVIKFIGAAVPPFETVSASGLFCLLALSGLLWRNRLPLLPKGNSVNTVTITPTFSNIGESTSSSGLPNRSSTARVTLLTLLRGAFGSVATTAFILSLQLLPLKDAVTLFFTSPVRATAGRVQRYQPTVMLAYRQGPSNGSMDILLFSGLTCFRPGSQPDEGIFPWTLFTRRSSPCCWTGYCWAARQATVAPQPQPSPWLVH
ncbi:hypothetical protein Vafri_13460 [Volvox africanus]|nr:hypothetical protein Vafri_13460 [Volvox africanus]